MRRFTGNLFIVLIIALVMTLIPATAFGDKPVKEGTGVVEGANKGKKGDAPGQGKKASDQEKTSDQAKKADHGPRGGCPRWHVGF